MKKYTKDDYIKSIQKNGLKKTWHSILLKTLNNQFESDLFKIDNYGELYEIGLEYENKINKKEMGKYYTPKDVAGVMSNWLIPLKGENICDVGCGVGNLILSYLETIGEEQTKKILQNGNIYLYDMDEIALEICKYTIAIKYGKENLKKVHIKCCDFLNKKIKLPNNSKVISNPPYYKITDYGEDWEITRIISESKELYSAFIDKILTQSESSVIITPYSYIGGGKFSSLREKMNQYNGFVVSFDNVPGNIFCGKKHGIFNSNKGNSVRAAIMVVQNKENINGFRFSPLIRFKTEERNTLLNNDYLNSLINDRYQISNNKIGYYKCHKDLLKIFDKWNELSNQKIQDITSSKEGEIIYVPTTCRYFTVGSKMNLSRNGKRTIYVKDKEKYNYVYCLLNSTFAYWYWRIYDGGINCPLAIINNIPVFYDRLNEKQKHDIDSIATEMQQLEKKYLVYKVNAGKKQENIKFPKIYRERINTIFLDALGVKENVHMLDKIHSSSLFDESDGEINEF